MEEISREQAKWIALKSVGFPKSEHGRWLVSVTAGSTDSPVPGAYRTGPRKHCNACWIVQISNQPVGTLDGECTYVFVDQRTGEVVESVRGHDGG